MLLQVDEPGQRHQTSAGVGAVCGWDDIFKMWAENLWVCLDLKLNTLYLSDDGNTIEEKDLGVKYNQASFDDHIHNICQKVEQTTGRILTF